MKRETIKGTRIYHRQRDLYGYVESYEGDGMVKVKYEWPYDPAAPAVLISLEELVEASVMS